MTVSIARRSTRFLALLALPLVAAACGDQPPPPPPPPATVDAPTSAKDPIARDSFRVAFETSRGNFVVAVKRALSPNGVDRFHELVRSGYFSDVRFFRVLPGFMAQFGMNGDPKLNEQWKSKPIVDDPVLETNKRGTIVFAKTQFPNSRSTQLFINFGDNAMLDSQGFSPFGYVVEGMSVVDAIHSGYGETPDQGRIAAEGNAYLAKEFPQLDYIKSAKIVK